MVKKIIKFSAEWCGPCKTLAPIFHKISKMEEFKDIEFSEIDVDDEKYEDIILLSRLRSVPTIIMYDENGKDVMRVLGNLPEQQLYKIISETVNRSNN